MISKARKLLLMCEAVFIPKGNMGIARDAMPQITSKDVPDFIKYLKSNKVKATKASVKAKDLKPTQKEIKKERVIELATSAAANLDKPLIISNDMHVLDGHHRWLALIHRDAKAKINVVKVDIPMKDLLEIAKKYPKVVYKKID